jgi:hypothetical protein
MLDIFNQVYDLYHQFTSLTPYGTTSAYKLNNIQQTLRFYLSYGIEIRHLVDASLTNAEQFSYVYYFQLCKSYLLLQRN